MSNEINAVEFKTFINGSHTLDGSHALLKFGTVQGDFTIALPDDQITMLMTTLTTIAAQNAQLKAGEKAQKQALPCVFWNFDVDANKAPTLTFRIQGGAEMSFQVGKSNLPLMREAIEAMEAKLKTA